MNNLILQAQEAQACRACDLAQSRRQAVFGSGPSDARLMVIGEAPQSMGIEARKGVTRADLSRASVAGRQCEQLCQVY